MMLAFSLPRDLLVEEWHETPPPRYGRGYLGFYTIGIDRFFAMSSLNWLLYAVYSGVLC
jgi:hypothetical protein